MRGSNGYKPWPRTERAVTTVGGKERFGFVVADHSSFGLGTGATRLEVHVAAYKLGRPEVQDNPYISQSSETIVDGSQFTVPYTRLGRPRRNLERDVDRLVGKSGEALRQALVKAKILQPGQPIELVSPDELERRRKVEKRAPTPVASDAA